MKIITSKTKPTHALILILALLLFIVAVGTMMPRQRVRATGFYNEFTIGSYEIINSRTNDGFETFVYYHGDMPKHIVHAYGLSILVFRGIHSSPSFSTHRDYFLEVAVLEPRTRGHTILWHRGTIVDDRGEVRYISGSAVTNQNTFDFSTNPYTFVVQVTDNWIFTYSLVFHFWGDFVERIWFNISVLGTIGLVSTANLGLTTFHNFLYYSYSHPTRDGYTFLGWYHDSAFTQPVLATDAIVSNMTIYANMQPVANTDSGANDSGNSNNNAGSGSNSSNGNGDDGDGFNFMYFIQNNPIAQYALIGVGIFVLLSVGIPLLKSLIGGTKQ